MWNILNYPIGNAMKISIFRAHRSINSIVVVKSELLLDVSLGVGSNELKRVQHFRMDKLLALKQYYTFVFTYKT